MRGNNPRPIVCYRTVVDIGMGGTVKQATALEWLTDGTAPFQRVCIQLDSHRLFRQFIQIYLHFKTSVR